MENLFIYLLKVHLAIALFYLVYQLVLSKNTSLVVKRFYLLGSLLLAFSLPFVNISFDLTNSIQKSDNLVDFQGFEQLSRIQFLPTTETVNSIIHFDSFSIALVIYLIIGVFVFCYVAYDLAKIIKSIKRNKKEKTGRLNFVLNEEYKSPFSFFNFIFTKSLKNLEETPEYLHELAHVKQLHSIDRLLVEFILPLLWINPFIYLFKKSMIEVHEHLADSAVLKNGIEATDYQNYLYLQLKSGQLMKLTSNFNYSLTKKRITMISKNISTRKSVLRIAISIILVSGILVFYGFNNAKIVDPLVQTKSKYVDQDISDPIPSILPLKAGGDYYIGANYGMQKHPILGYEKKHIGIDIVADRGTEVIATADGSVFKADYAGGYGNCVRIKHSNKLETRYAHLHDFNVKPGDKVKMGDVVGYVGSTGLSTAPHLHYEVVKDGENVNPADYIKNIKEIPAKKKEK